MVLSALGDQPLSTTARWVDSPNERGTFNIISNCVLTLVLCVWTSIHLNIPRAKDGGKPYKKKKKEQQQGESGGVETEGVGASFPWKKVKYVLLALIMPEVIAAVAFNQWLEQRSLLKYINSETELGVKPEHQVHEHPRVSDEEMANTEKAVQGKVAANSATEMEESAEKEIGEGVSIIQAPTLNPSEMRQAELDKDVDSPQDRGQNTRRRSAPWTSLHCWYALMGGFVIDNSSPSSFPFPLPNTHLRLALTSDAIKLLAAHHPSIFPSLRASEIADKSKSSELAKFIVCMQVAWFIFNTIGRVSQGLPLTVLELNTAAHCICTFVTYAFWWHKPLDIVQPSGVVLTKEAAEMAAQMCLRSSATGWLLREEETYSQASLYKRFTGYMENEFVAAPDFSDGSILIITPEDMPSFRLCVLAEEADRASRWLKVHVKTENELTPDECKRTSRDTSNSRARIRNFESILDLTRMANSHHLANPSLSWAHSPFCDSFLTAANPNHPFTTLRTLATGTSGLSFIAACTLYALVHGFAWNGPFKSHAELYLWRMGVLAFLPLMLLTPVVFLAAWRRSEAYGKLYTRLNTLVRNRLEANRNAIMRLWCQRPLHLGTTSYIIMVWIPMALLQIPLFFFKIFFSRPIIFVYALLATLGFLTGRAFLVVEAFLALPYAPEGAFAQPDWTAYLPHFG